MDFSNSSFYNYSAFIKLRFFRTSILAATAAGFHKLKPLSPCALFSTLTMLLQLNCILHLLHSKVIGFTQKRQWNKSYKRLKINIRKKVGKFKEKPMNS